MKAPDEKRLPPADVLRPLRRRAAVAWAGFALSLGLLWAEHRLSVLHPRALLFLALLCLAVLPGLGALARGIWRLLRGPRRGPALAWTAVALAPSCLWLALAWSGFHRWARRDLTPDIPNILTRRAGASLMEAQARFLYPNRLETERLVMFYDGRVAHPRRDAEEMDRHLADLEGRTGLPLRGKVYWVRGRALGLGPLASCGLVLGSAQSPEDWQAAGGLDRHELAHAVLTQHYSPDTDPPTLLVEGWAESQSRSEDDKGRARQALATRRFFAEWGPLWARASESGRDQMARTSAGFADRQALGRLLEKTPDGGGTVSYLRELTDPYWYHRDSGPVYPVGGAFVNFLLRRAGAGRFVDLYFACRPGTFEAECRRVYGADLDSLEAEFWEDAERLAGEP